MKNSQQQGQEKTAFYQQLIQIAMDASNPGKLFHFREFRILKKALKLFGPQFASTDVLPALYKMYGLAVHLPTKALVIASPPSQLSSETSRYLKRYDLSFQSFSVYMPHLGIEVAQVGRIGRVDKRLFVLRSESACSPAFLFGAQNCNCAKQWLCTQELAAHFNSERLPIGFLMVYLESQNGMGMGHSPDVFSIDLGHKASMRYAGCLAASQKYQWSIQESCQAFGLQKDARQAVDGAAYQITPIILDYLQAHSQLILLSNNPNKIRGLKLAGFSVHRLKSLGEITAEGVAEAKQRASDFEQLDIGEQLSDFDSEFQRLKIQIQESYQQRE